MPPITSRSFRKATETIKLKTMEIKELQKVIEDVRRCVSPIHCAPAAGLPPPHVSWRGSLTTAVVMGIALVQEKDQLKKQQNLYEQVRSDRNAYSKAQIQSEDEIAEMKRKFTIMTHQIEQLKEEIQAKDNALINEHYEFKRLQDKEKGALTSLQTIERRRTRGVT